MTRPIKIFANVLVYEINYSERVEREKDLFRA